MTQGRVERRLAAILAADVAGYGRLMGADEEGTLRALKEHRQAVFDPQIAAHHGRVVKTTGDGLLVEFASVLDAVECACAVQLAIAGRNAAVAPDRRLEFRIGINLGDVMIDGGDIYGDGVNIAARLEALAEPGSVCVSGAVRDQLGDKRLLDFRDMGEHSVKNIARPLRVYRVEARAEDGIAVPVATTPAILALQDRPSVAVLPFTNMSGDAEQDYFADGMVEDIITALSRFKELFVIARNSSFIYKGRAVDIRQVGRELGVRYVLEGSVRKAGNRVRITGQLIEAATRSHLWADRFDAAIEDVFELQDRITESVVGALVPTLRQAEIERARRKPPADLSAYDLYLRALPSLWAGTSDGVAKAIALLRSSLDRDPMHTPALAALAWGLAMAAPLGGNTATNGRTNALKMARQAVEQDSTDAFAQAVYGYTLYGPAGQDEQGRIHSQEAVRLNPSSEERRVGKECRSRWSPYH